MIKDCQTDPEVRQWTDEECLYFLFQNSMWVLDE